MLFMNTWDIAEAQARFRAARTPELAKAVHILSTLEKWTNAHSDGWAYWPKPARAANALMTLIQGVDVYQLHVHDVTAAEVRKACQPIRAFLTRQGVDHTVIFGAQRGEDHA